MSLSQKFDRLVAHDSRYFDAADRIAVSCHFREQSSATVTDLKQSWMINAQLALLAQQFEYEPHIAGIKPHHQWPVGAGRLCAENRANRVVSMANCQAALARACRLLHDLPSGNLLLLPL